MFRRIISAIFIAIIVSNQLVTTAQATPEYDEMFYSGNDILYDPRCDTSMVKGEILSLNGDSNIDKIMKFLIAPAQGLSVAQAAGVIGKFYGGIW